MARTVTQRRIDRIESILRDRSMHEPACFVRLAEKAAGQVPVKKLPACTCWLAEATA